MDKAKKLKIGALIAGKYKFKNKDGREIEKTLVSLAFGSENNKDPKYDVFVEVIVRDSRKVVLHRQENGYINLTDPRALPDELYTNGLIKEDVYAEMKAKTKKLNEKLKYNIEVAVTTPTT